MSLYFKCPVCGKKLKADDNECGSLVACTACRTRIVVPAFGTSAQSAGEDEGEAEPSSSAGLTLPSAKLAGHEDLIDMTAMVDIVFFLLIFFLVTSMQEVMASLETPPPDPEKVTAQGRKTAIELDADAASVRIESDDSIWLDGGQVPSEQELRARLRAARREGVSKMVVIGHGDAHHKTLVMVLDAGNDAGIDDLKFLVSDEEP